MVKIRPMAYILDNGVLGAVKASINMEKHMVQRGILNSREQAIRYAVSTILSYNSNKKEVIALLDRIISRAKEIKVEIKKGGLHEPSRQY